MAEEKIAKNEAENSGKNVDRVKAHEYDGIQEYDNQLPRWWLVTFVFTVIFGLAYWAYYQIYQIGPNQIQAYELAMAAHEEEFKQPEPEVNEELIISIQKDTAAMQEAATIFQENCIPCHGAQGQGGIGPNLTDDYWIHGAKAENLYHTITTGVADKGMPTWKGLFTPQQIVGLVAHVKSLHGTNPPNAKEPQGELVKPE